MMVDLPNSDGGSDVSGITVKDFSFQYPNPYGESVPALENVDFDLPVGSRCLLLGANGAGKSTMLRILAGKHLHDENKVLVFGNPACFLAGRVSGVSYVGTSGWTRSVAFAGSSVAFQADIPAKEMMKPLQDRYPERRDELYELLEIDPEWRMHMVSDGQRRRVQIMLAMLRPFKVLLLDEVTVDLDVVGRADFLQYLKNESETRGATIMYATHIFDGMNDWPTHIVFLNQGKVFTADSYENIQRKKGFRSLYHYVERNLRMLRDEHRKDSTEGKEDEEKKKEKAKLWDSSVQPNSGYSAGRMNEFLSLNEKDKIDS